MSERSVESAKGTSGAVPEKPRSFWTRDRDALRAPDLTVPQEMPGSWARRITDERNLWLTAIQHQLQGDLGEAALRYLEDARQEVLRDQRARSALSLAMAGFVLREAGEEPLATVCYRGAARQFRRHADQAVESSPRDALWSLERAATFYALGQQREEIEEVRAKFMVLNAALHPDQADRVPEVFLRPTVEVREPPRAGGPTPSKGVRISREYVAQLQKLLERL